MRKNKGKVPLSKALLFPRAMDGMAAVIEFGEQKYTPAQERGWLNYDERETMDSALRHLQAQCCGEAKDPESGLPHIWHALFNIAVLCELSGYCFSEDSSGPTPPEDSGGH